MSKSGSHAGVHPRTQSTRLRSIEIRYCLGQILIFATVLAARGTVSGQGRADGLVQQPGVAKMRAPKKVAQDASAPPVVRGAEPEPAPGEESAKLPVPDSRPQLTLDYVSRLAVENHPLLRRDQARIESAAGQALQKGLYPNLRFDSNNPQVFNGQNTLIRPGVQMDLVVKGKLRLDRAAALRVQQQSENVLIQDKFGLLTAVRSQFYTVLTAQTRVDVWKRLLLVTSASVQTGQERVKATVANRQELLLLQIDDNKVRASLANATQVLEGERRQLAAIVGFQRTRGLENVVGSLGDPAAAVRRTVHGTLRNE